MNTLLVIDDQQDNLTTIEAVIKVHLPGCKILTALSGAQGLLLAQQEQPDTILLDIIMPGMDGYEVCEKLKADESTKHIPVVMVTAIKTDTESRVKGLNMGADAFLSKPIDPVELSAQVMVMLRIKKAEDELRSEKESLEELVEEKTMELSDKNKKLQHEITVREQAGEKLKESNEQYKMLLNQIADPIFVFDQETKRILDINEATINKYGYSAQELQTMTPLDLHHKEEDHEHVNRNIDDKEQTTPNEYLHERKDGTVFMVETHTNEVFYKGRKAWLTILRDVTERKAAEDALNASEQKFRDMSNLLPQTIFEIDSRGKLIYSNKQGFKSFGYTQEDYEKGFNIAQAIIPEDRGNAIKSIQDILSGKVAEVLEYTALRKDGSTFPVLIYSSPILVGNRPVGLRGTIVDITERKLTEEILKESENRFKVLSEATYEAIFISKNGICVDTNEAACKIFGYAYDELIGIFGTDVIAPESKEFVREKMLSGFEQPYDVMAQRKDGTIFPGEFHGRMFEYKGQQVRVTAVRDITARKKAEEDLIFARKRAEESDRLKSAFLATMSHELRTPLNAIIGFSDLIDEDLTMEEIITFNKTINTSGNHLLSIVEDIFDITLIESGEIKIVKEDINIPTILLEIQEVIKFEQQSMGKEKISLNLVNPPDGNNLTLSTDPARFKQILINLLKNALKFTLEGHINFGYNIIADVDKPMVHFFVEDSGIGIPREKQHFIFEIFRQVEDSYTRKYGGAGLGLSIAKKLTEYLGGTIWLESEEGKGSTFNFTIPSTEVEEIDTSVAIEVADKKNVLSGKTILVVEDIEYSYEFLKVILEKSGVEVIWAKNGEEAINFCKEKNNIDLVLMDINMPVMNGYDATKEIRKFKPGLPIIAQTAYAIAGDREKSIDAGCNDYVSKPIKKEELFAKIIKVFG